MQLCGVCVSHMFGVVVVCVCMCGGMCVCMCDGMCMVCGGGGVCGV